MTIRDFDALCNRAAADPRARLVADFVGDILGAKVSFPADVAPWLSWYGRIEWEDDDLADAFAALRELGATAKTTPADVDNAVRRGISARLREEAAAARAAEVTARLEAASAAGDPEAVAYAKTVRRSIEERPEDTELRRRERARLFGADDA